MVKILLFIGVFTALFFYLGFRLKVKDSVVIYATTFSFLGIFLSFIFQYGGKATALLLSQKNDIIVKELLAKKQFIMACFLSFANLLMLISFLGLAIRLLSLLHTYYFKQKLIHYTKRK